MDGRSGPASRVRESDYRPRWTRRDGVGVHTLDPGRWGGPMARRRRSDLDEVHHVPARITRTAAGLLVDALHARPRFSPRETLGWVTPSAKRDDVAPTRWIGRPTGTRCNFSSLGTTTSHLEPSMISLEVTVRVGPRGSATAFDLRGSCVTTTPSPTRRGERRGGRTRM